MARILYLTAGTFGVIVLAGMGMGCRTLSAPRYEGPLSDHFDGRRFRNPSPVPEHGFKELVKWMRSHKRGQWRPYSNHPPGPPPPQRVALGEMRVTFINHATTLIQMDGLNILTDPIWSERASPVSFVGPKRKRPPGIRFEDLPPIDAVLISHNHYDHLDLPTLRRLAKAYHPRILVGLGNRALLEEAGISGATDLDWWQGCDLAPGVRLTAVPAQHFSNRGFGDSFGTLWAGYVIQGPSGAAYFAGDTGFGPHFQQIAERFRPLRLALLPIGAFRPRWFMSPVHMSPQEAVKAAQILGASTNVAIHFGTFELADDGQDEPIEALYRALAAARPAPRFWVLDFGEGRRARP